jgi:hypothetical protein
LLDRAVVPVADAPPDPVLADVVLPAPAEFDRPPPLEVDPVAEPPDVVPVAAVVAVVCAAASGTSAIRSGNTKIDDLRMRLTTPPPPLKTA